MKSTGRVRRGGGSRKGIPNKVSASAKENVIAVFTRLGGTATMARWANRNKSEFYRLYARLIPLEHTGEDGGPLVVELVRFADKTARQ